MFKLNNEPMSEFRIGALSFPAFSGSGLHVNNRSLVCTPKFGAIPVGHYYIFDRQSGGVVGPFMEWLNLNGNDKSDWYALYAIDGNIDDDKVLCDKIVRSQLRLHPKGRLGVSEGCVTIEQRSDWVRIRSILTNVPKISVPGSALKAYGVLTVS
ncbi:MULTISPECIES: DUF2778 domain-containing protein [Burkholderia]|jgi:hypothetical protein|uniref:DUF2778 domain-containing protein n=1 Tax=Burkholderia TaxID=32008 RepID=UPI0028F3E6ED|nr:DUF2778 domain-containing protein [Burkholderia sp. KBS0801]